MSIGYACLAIGVPDTGYRSCMLKNATESRLLELIAHNLNSLENMIDYNISNGIMLFRITSDLIPFGSSPVNGLDWWDTFGQEFRRIGEKISTSGMRVSMHPGQYTVLNSPNEDVVDRAIEDLNYHCRVLDSLGTGSEHKIVLHIGGVYGNKEEAMDRFIRSYGRLPEEVKSRLVLENDDKSYNIYDVIGISQKTGAPVVFDNLHNQVNPCAFDRDDVEWIADCGRTWKEKDGRQKIHYSQQDKSKKPGSHSDTIRIAEFMEYYEKIDGEALDIMLEVKDKNISALKCINCTRKDRELRWLELEWSRYKYRILEISNSDYLDIRRMLNDKTDYPAFDFYLTIEGSIKKEATARSAINAAQHVWGYFKDVATSSEKKSFLRSIEQYREGRGSLRSVKNSLRKMAVKYERTYLLNSYYFEL